MVKKIKDYIPDRGDIVWLEFDPQKGKEILKKRPALVISPKNYNQKVGLSICMPITSQIKGYPFEVILDMEEICGAILADQVKSLDWKARNAKFIVRCDDKLLSEATFKLKLLLD